MKFIEPDWLKELRLLPQRTGSVDVVIVFIDDIDHDATREALVNKELKDEMKHTFDNYNKFSTLKGCGAMTRGERGFHKWLKENRNVFLTGCVNDVKSS